MSKTLTTAAVAGLIAAGLAVPADAGVTVYDKDGKKIEVGARIQLQYTRFDPADGETTDEFLFRRLRPYVAGTVSEDWWGKLQVDFGKAIDGDEIAIKDAYVQYLGWENLELTIGNSKTPFSREFLASSKRQQTVERGFVGDHNFGTPDRQLGVKLASPEPEKARYDEVRLTWALAAGAENHDPDVRRVDFDTPVNNQSDWNEGVVLAGRLDFHPQGYVSFDQGAFHPDDPAKADDVKLNFSLAAFTWSNDGDVNPYTDPVTGRSTSSSRADLDSAEGFELSAGLRGRGVSIDAEIQRISADTVDPVFTGGVYRAGTTELDKHHLEGGYIFPENRFELVAAWSSLDADNYDDAWTTTELGVNYFWNQHKVKVQFTYRIGENLFGVRGNDADETFVQFQFVF